MAIRHMTEELFARLDASLASAQTRDDGEDQSRATLQADPGPYDPSAEPARDSPGAQPSAQT